MDARHGLEHPDERFEFARFCLLCHYGRNEEFMSELRGLAQRHSSVLRDLAQAARGAIRLAVDYRAQWALLSFLARPNREGDRGSRGDRILAYRWELTNLALRWGLPAPWCAPSLHQALVAPLMYPQSQQHGRGSADVLTPFFTWNELALGKPNYDTQRSLLRLLALSDAIGRHVDFRLFTRGDRHVYYDPRVDSWRQVLFEVRKLLRKQRLSRSISEQLDQRRSAIETALMEAGYRLRPKPRRLDGEHALARWTRWTYWARCPPGMTTRRILDRIEAEGFDPDRPKDPQVVNRGIKKILDLLGLPPRPVRAT